MWSRWRERVWAAVAVSALVAALVLGVIVSRSSSRAPAQLPIRLAIPLPPGQYLDGFGAPALALSNDGRALAFVARGATGVQHLYVRSLDSESATLVPGSDTAEGPFFSPDGRWVGFAVGVSITGGYSARTAKVLPRDRAHADDLSDPMTTSVASGAPTI